MRILAIDVGTGTQDILLFDSSQEIENCHHPAFSPREIMLRTITPAATPPARAPAMRRAVARVTKATTIVRARYKQLNRWSCCVVS